MGACFLLIFIPILTSWVILRTYQPEQNETITVTVVQPNIDPYNEKYALSNQDLYNRLIKQIGPALNKNTDLIVTPETYFSEGSGEYFPNFEQSKLYTDLLSFATTNKLQFLHGISFTTPTQRQKKRRVQTSFITVSGLIFTMLHF